MCCHWLAMMVIGYYIKSWLLCRACYWLMEMLVMNNVIDAENDAYSTQKNLCMHGKNYMHEKFVYHQKPKKIHRMMCQDRIGQIGSLLDDSLKILTPKQLKYYYYYQKKLCIITCWEIILI